MPLSTRGWAVLGLGVAASLAPLVWEQLLAEYPADLGLGLVLLYAWSVLPFFMLAVLADSLGLRTVTVWLVAALVTAATVAVQVAVIFYPQSSTDSLAFIFVPIWLSVAVGLLAACELGVRALARLRRG